MADYGLGSFGAIKPMKDKVLSRLRGVSSRPIAFEREVANFRTALSPMQYMSLIEKIRRVKSRHPNGLIKAGKRDWADLCNVMIDYQVSFQKDLYWYVIQLGDYNQIIEKHLNLFERVSIAISNEEYEVALDLLDEHESHLGVSLWAIQLRVACLMRMDEGVDKAVSLVRGVFEKGQRSLLSYLVYQFFDCYHEETTHAGFQRRHEQSIRQLDDEHLRQYLEV